MKKKVFLIPLALFMTAGTVMVAGCGEKKPDPVVVQTLDSISVTKLPTKLEYNAGDTFDPTGLEVTAKYSDGSTKVLTGTDYTLNPTQNLQAGTSKISVSYEEGGVTKNAEIAITVHSVTPPPVEKVLDSISVVKGPDKTEYVEGDAFDPTGMEVKAIYDDGSDKVLTGVEYTISPTQNLAVGTDHVTITYEEGGVTKTADVAITVNGPVIPTNYGTEDNPLSVTEAIAILEAECINDNDMTKQAITAIGTIKNIRKTFDYDKDGKDDCFELDLTDETNDIYIYRVHATPEIAENIALNSTLKFVGFAKNYKGTLEFVDNGNEHQCTALSAVKSSKVAVSISDVVGPSEVALNGSIAVSEVTLTVNYDDESKLEGQHPDSIDLDTSEAGDKVATVHYGELTGSFNVTVKNEESPNQFVDAYNAAAGLEYRSSTTESYNFKGVVVAKRGTEYYVQYEGYGIDVYGPSTTPAIGDLIEVNSLMKNFEGTIETGTINKIAILESEQELPAAAEVTSAEVLGNLKQNILANVAGTAKEDITTIDTSKDYTLALMVGTDEIPVFIKKAALATLKDKLVGVKAGDAISITGAVTGEHKGTKQVLVVDGSTINIPRPVSGVAFEEEAYSVLVGETVTVKANVLPEDADDKVVSYSLANPSDGVEATIDAETGVVTAGAVAGTVEVVATAHGDSTKTASVTLIISSAAIPVTGVTLDKETMTIEMKGEAPWTGSLTATVAPADATDKTYTFSSSAEEVATVTNEGAVTGLKEGECDITVTTTDGAKTAVCHVSVIPEQPIVKEGTYTIKHVKSGTAYYMVDPNASSSPTASTNLADAAVFDFILQEGTLNQYKIKIHGENKYLYVTKSNSGLRIGNTEAVWTIANGSQATGAFDMSCSDGENVRYLTLFNTQDFRCYTNTTTNRSENTDLEAVVVKDVESIAIKQNPTKMSYYVGEAFDPTGMIVTVTYTDESTEDITEGFTYEGSTGFQAANPDRTVKVTYKTKNAYVQHVEVKEDDRTITSIKIDSTSDMTTKKYNVGDAWNAAGLKVIAVRSDLSEFEVTKDATFTYSPEAPAAGVTSVTVTAHYKIDETTTLDSEGFEVSGITVIAPDYVMDFTKTDKFTGLPTAAKAATKTGSFTVVSENDWNYDRAYDGGSYCMLKTKSFGDGDSTTGISFIANATALSGSIARVEVDIPSSASASATYALKYGTSAITDLTDAQFTTTTGNNKTYTFEIETSDITFIAFGCNTTSYNGQFSAIRIFYK